MSEIKHGNKILLWKTLLRGFKSANMNWREQIITRGYLMI